MPLKRYTQSLWMRCHSHIHSLSAVQPYLEGKHSCVVSYLGDRAVMLAPLAAPLLPESSAALQRSIGLSTQR